MHAAAWADLCAISGKTGAIHSPSQAGVLCGVMTSLPCCFPMGTGLPRRRLGCLHRCPAPLSVLLPFFFVCGSLVSPSALQLVLGFFVRGLVTLLTVGCFVELITFQCCSKRRLCGR